MRVKVVAVVIAVIFIAGAVGTVIVLSSPPTNTVRISSAGEVIYTIDLNTAGDGTFEIKTDSGVNIVEIKDHRIRVSDADCPDKTCVNMGWLSGSAMPIVCLPHQLVIEFTDGASDVDAVTR